MKHDEKTMAGIRRKMIKMDKRNPITGLMQSEAPRHDDPPRPKPTGLVKVQFLPTVGVCPQFQNNQFERWNRREG